MEFSSKAAISDSTTILMPVTRIICTGFLAALSLHTVAVAEERVLEEVVVTAQKRAESIQDIPIAVSVINARDLEILGIQESSDLTRASASLTYSEGGDKQSSSFRIRGIGTAINSISVEPSVSVIIDNISLIQPGQAFTNLVDVERVEVLRGPQSTLFGKNASAGLINVVTKRSSDSFEGFVESSFTDDGELRLKGSLSGPLGDTLGYHLSAFYRDYDGYAENIHLNNEDINGNELKGFRGRLDWTPTDNVDVSLIVFSSSEDDNCCAPTHRSVAPGAVFAGFIPIELMNPLTIPSESNQNPETDFPPNSETKDDGFSLQADWSLGEHTLTSITAYNNWEYDFAEDFDWSGFDFSSFLSFLPSGGIAPTSKQETELFSQELRLLSPSGGNWEYLVGLYYADSDTERDYDNTFPLAFSVWNASTSTETKAIFGQVTWRMTEQTHLTLGGRYNDEEFSVAYLSEQDASGAIRADYSDSNGDDVVLGKLSLQHFLDEDTMLFASVTTGYKGGAYEISGGEGQDQAANPIDAETSVSWELGAKTTLLDQRVQFNINAFYTLYEDYQAQRTVFVNNELRSTLTNVGELETQGLELDAVALLGEHLTLTLSAAWIDAGIKEYSGANCYPGQTEAEGCVELTPGDTATRVQDLAGKDLNNSPDWKFNLGAQYDVPLPGLPFDGFITAAYTWQDELNFSVSNNPATVQDSYGVANLSLGINERMDNRYSVSVFIHNVFDEVYASGIADVSPIYGNAKTLLHHIPRSAGRYAGLKVRLGF